MEVIQLQLSKHEAMLLNLLVLMGLSASIGSPDPLLRVLIHLEVKTNKDACQSLKGKTLQMAERLKELNA